MIVLHRVCIAFALGLGAAACGSSSSDGADCGPAPDVTANAPAQATAADVQPILAKNCAVGGCHLNGAGGLVLDVASPSWVKAVVGVPAQENPSINLVTAGDPDQSWLVDKIFGRLCGDACDPRLGCGAQMPFGTALSDIDRGTIVAWIDAGAPGN
jgi:hypothetical protein